MAFIFILYRYTILEPGPVETPRYETAEIWGKAISHEKADEKTKKLMEISNENFDHISNKNMMNSSEIAAIVQEIILGQNTNFRCYTHVNFFPEVCAAKLKDSATNKPIEIMRKQLFEKRGDEAQF